MFWEAGQAGDQPEVRAFSHPCQSSFLCTCEEFDMRDLGALSFVYFPIGEAANQGRMLAETRPT